jgi:hypothetical protein
MNFLFLSVEKVTQIADAKWPLSNDPTAAAV